MQDGGETSNGAGTEAWPTKKEQEKRLDVAKGVAEVGVPSY